ncbi:MAG: OB-fold nucleic acid binding domain-containing protein, partial [Promethearchaeota archaeon]
MSELNVNFDENKLKKRDALLKKGINLYPHNYKREIGFKEIKELYKDIGHEKSKKTVVIAGSVQVIRRHGRTIFVDLKDETGYLQLYLREDSLGKEKFQFFKDYVDSGDIIGANGNVFRTKLGEISIWVNDFLILAKSLSLLPEKYHGLKDVAKR